MALAFIALALVAIGAPGSLQASEPVSSRNLFVARDLAAENPRSEGDQVLHRGWPLYRSERGQAAFNQTMATLEATDGKAPSADAFSGCRDLGCPLELPRLDGEGWLPPGRIWVSPTRYVLFVRSDRNGPGRSYRRRGARGMRYFVLHEFHNSTRNTDTFDTISSHSGSVFVPFYLSKTGTDAKGRHYVAVVQVAPYDVVSRHASNMGSAGPGIEVAKNYTDPLEPLQGHAGILVATMLTEAAPQLRVVNHRGIEGRPMLDLYRARLKTLRAKEQAAPVRLPFTPADPARIATADSLLGDLIRRSGVSPSIPIAERAIVPRRMAVPSPARRLALAAPPPLTIGDLLARMAGERRAWIAADPADEASPRLIGPVRLAVRPVTETAPSLVAPVRPASRPAATTAAPGG